MSEAQPTAAPIPAMNGAGVITNAALEDMSVEERADAVFSKSDDDLAEGDGPEGQVGESPAAAPLAGADAERAKRIETNRAKLDEFKRAQRVQVDSRSLQQENERLKAQIAASSTPDNRIDPSTLNEEKFFALAEDLKLPPQKLFDWLKKSVDRPELATIRKEVDPKLSAIESENRALKERLDALEGNLSSNAQQAEEQRAANGMFTFAKSNAPTSPLSARFLEEHGPEEFYTLALSASANVPPGAGHQAILDEIEDRLTQLGRIYGPKTAAPQRPAAIPPRTNPAAAKAPTHVTNQLASQRSSVVDEDAEFESLSLDERAARLFAR